MKLSRNAVIYASLLGLIAVVFAVAAAMRLQRDLLPKTPATVRFDRLITDKLPNELLLYAFIEDRDGNALNEALSPSDFKLRVDARPIRAFQKIQRTGDITRSAAPLVAYPSRNEPRTGDTPSAVSAPASSVSALTVHYEILFSVSGDTAANDAQIEAICEFVWNMRAEDTVSVKISLNNLEDEVIDNKPQSQLITIRETLTDRVNSADLRQYLNGEASLYWSIDQLARIEPAATERKALIVLSDGAYEAQWFTRYGLEQFAERRNIPVYVVAFKTAGQTVSPRGQLYKLEELARVSGGAYHYTDTIADIPHELRLLQAKIAHPYLFRLNILNVRAVQADSAVHNFELTLTSARHTGSASRKLLVAKTVHSLGMVQSAALVVVFVALVLVAALLALYILLSRARGRSMMGISKRRCPECHTLLKDSWDACPFCAYIPTIKKHKKKEKKGKKEA
ncbi:MAG: hypothetical protein LBS86_06880 [Treponema sp.]|jgi:hypothetical protein|nr:hypothetical protein [Treponema sp.]